MAIVTSMLAAFRASAQDTASFLSTRLDPHTRLKVEQVIEAARADSLPTTPLVNKALEGASKGAPGPRILAAVQALALHLGTARQALGAAATQPEIVIGAEALRAGATSATLRGLRAAAGSRSLNVPLTVLSALVGRGVPVDTAAAVVTTLADQGASDRDFLDLQRTVERDIGAGVAPGAAAAVRGLGGPPAGVPAHSNGHPDRPDHPDHPDHPNPPNRPDHPNRPRS